MTKGKPWIGANCIFRENICLKVHLDFRGEGSSNRNATRDESVETTGMNLSKPGTNLSKPGKKNHSNHDIYIYIYIYMPMLISIIT